ncbi:hypothetical protein [Mycoplasmopsis cynos]|uniref:hypothetical protein n=1 Tax=Mycoplasmopsis cynos TaxID=171284 RepID=UPI0022070C41|nr:hypothetical protein [Mycoplasmopsis cynos]UWV85947.1 hypothetical protein NW063_03710 [Mycoplasmopsis cynos]WAM08047.1 hypothetical protein ONA21_01695 [Mycoplasmopsis cynos]
MAKNKKVWLAVGLSISASLVVAGGGAIIYAATKNDNIKEQQDALIAQQEIIKQKEIEIENARIELSNIKIQRQILSEKIKEIDKNIKGFSKQKWKSED